MSETVPKGSFVSELRQRLAEPIYNRIIKQHVGTGNLEYEIYLHTKTMLACQYPPEQRVLPEELMFQIVHQAQELWLKLLVHEGTELVGELDADALWNAARRIDRMIRIQRSITSEMGVLDSLAPEEFQIIRRSLGTGSGQESPGFNQLTYVLAPALEDAVKRLLERREVDLEQVYEVASRHPDLHRICELLVDFDELYQQWLMAHYQLVRRTIGVNRTVHALDGLPTYALLARMTQPLLPALWDVRIALTKRWTPGGGYPVGADRSGAPQRVG